MHVYMYIPIARALVHLEIFLTINFEEDESIVFLKPSEKLWMGTVFVDGSCSTVQGLLDWSEVDLRFHQAFFIQNDLCTVWFLDGDESIVYAYTCGNYYIYTHMACMYVDTSKSMQTRMYIIYIHMCVICICIYVYARVFACIYINICIYKHQYVYAYLRIYMYI